MGAHLRLHLTLRARCVAVALVAAVLLPTPAGAQDLDAAKERLTQLESRIKSEEANAKRLQVQLGRLSAQLASESGDLLEIRTDLKQTSRRLSTTTAHLSQLQDTLQTRARSLYKRGPLDLINVVLAGRSMPDFLRRASYASSVAERDEQLMLDMRQERAKLQELRDYQVRLERFQSTTVKRIANQQNLMIDVFAKQQDVLAGLAKTRKQVLTLVTKLEEQLSRSEAGRLRRVAGGGMTISYGEWAEAFLNALGAPVVRSSLVAVVAWEASEGTQATWNPLATTMPMPGATSYNSHNVRNYKSMKQGIDASILTLSRPNHGYDKILDGLERGAGAMDTGKAINASDWCRGCTDGQYVIGIIPAVEKYYERYAGE